MALKVEYLITYKIKGNFLENISSFNHLLMANSLISINEKKLVFREVGFEYDLVCHEIPDKSQRLFKVNLSTDKTENIELLTEILKIIREFIYRTDGKISIIWDDISNYYSIKAYPEINKIENLLRKLITYFMISNFGVEWTEESIPVEIKTNIKHTRDKNNFLHDTDFIQLADFLFKPYSNKSVEILFKDLKSLKNPETSNNLYYEQFVPKSNWERYFNNVVNCEDGYLLKNWNRLYELRCLIAHNSFISKDDYEEVVNIVNNLSEKFENAISAIDAIIIPQEEKEAVIESVLTAKNELVNQFFEQWRNIYEEVSKLYKKSGFNDVANDYPLKKMVEELIEKEVLNEDFLRDIEPIGNLRNKVLHLGEEITDNEIAEATAIAKSFYVHKILFEEPFI